jgi:dTDP-4-amino-4,6-dideoxygalactose transaminase
MILFSDVSFINRLHSRQLLAECSSVIEGGSLILGPALAEFEHEFANYCQSRFCVGVGNGLDALRLILKGFGIGPGDEVIVPSHTFVATWLAVSQVGAQPICADVHDDSLNLRISSLDRVLTDRTRAVIAVDLYGNPADIQALVNWAHPKSILVIEDAAQAHGAKCDGFPVGHRADATAWSFYPGKNLGALGDGGAVTTQNESLYEQLLLYRNYGSRQRYVHETQGFNSRLDSIQAAFLKVKLPHLDSWVRYRQELASIYRAALGEAPLSLQQIDRNSLSAYHLFVVRTPFRDLLKTYLTEVGIETLIHYPTPPYRQEAYLGKVSVDEKFSSKADRIAKEVLSLPLGIHLELKDVRFICASILDFFEKQRFLLKDNE